MSHEATNWAFCQPEKFQDMKPAEWAVLMVLANCHNPVNGCFPSQEYLSRKTNQDPRSVRRQLKKLHSRDLVQWDEAREGGRRGSNRYLLAFESEYSRQNDGDSQPDKLSGSIGISTGQNEQFQPDKFDSSNRTNCPPKEVRESVIESLGAKTREREDLDFGLDEKKKAKAIEIAFKEFAPRWPTWVHDSEPAARKAWGSLSDEERDQAVARFEDYIAASKTGGRTQTCSLARYLSEKKWEKLEPPKPKADKPIRLRPFGKGYMAHRFELMDRGRDKWKATGFLQKMIDDNKGDLITDARHKGEFPLVARMDAEAKAGRDVILRAGTPMPETQGYHAVKQGSPEWEAWEAWHMAMDYPWINPPKHQEYIWLPATIPTMPATVKEDECADG